LTVGAGVEAVGAGVEAVGAGVEAVGAGVAAVGAGVATVGAGVILIDGASVVARLGNALGALQSPHVTGQSSSICFVVQRYATSDCPNFTAHLHQLFVFLPMVHLSVLSAHWADDVAMEAMKRAVVSKVEGAIVMERERERERERVFND